MLHHTQKSTGVIARRQASVLLAKDPLELEQAYNEWSQTYDQDMVLLSGGENVSSLAATKVLIKHVDITKKDLQILDFGCGTGAASAFLSENGMDTKQQLDGVI